MLREIVMDTETTGLGACRAHWPREPGCDENDNRIPSLHEFDRYINPERDVHPEAVAVHGLTREFLRDKPLFAEVADEFLDFIGDAPLVAHNANFDVGFLNAELDRLAKPPLRSDRIVDTLMLARRRNPAGPNTLDALCKRFGIDNSERTKHGALVDSLLLAGVYVELLGERQATLGLGSQAVSETRTRQQIRTARQRPAPLPQRLSEQAQAAHREFVKTLGPDALWLRYLTVPQA
jgi:DNA polymerase-3 subunit epsilon